MESTQALITAIIRGCNAVQFEKICKMGADLNLSDALATRRFVFCVPRYCCRITANSFWCSLVSCLPLCSPWLASAGAGAEPCCNAARAASTWAVNANPFCRFLHNFPACHCLNSLKTFAAVPETCRDRWQHVLRWGPWQAHLCNASFSRSFLDINLGLAASSSACFFRLSTSSSDIGAAAGTSEVSAGSFVCVAEGDKGVVLWPSYSYDLFKVGLGPWASRRFASSCGAVRV